jgi:Lipocalin-like domain
VRRAGEDHMNRRSVLAVCSLAALCIGGLSESVQAQQKKFNPRQITGHWTLAAVDNVAPDGTHSQTFGSNPSGVAIFEPNHRFSVSIVNPNLPKFASNNRNTGTADEHKAVVQGSLFYFGTYMLATDGSLSLEIEGSSFPNWMHVNQERKVTVLTKDEIKWTNPVSSIGGTAELDWKRTK